MSYKFLDFEDLHTATVDELNADLREAEKQFDAARQAHPGNTIEAIRASEDALDDRKEHIDKLYHALSLR